MNLLQVATPIAASLGDLITLALLAWIASFLFQYIQNKDRRAAVIIIIVYILISIICIYFARKNQFTAVVLKTGWKPVLIAMTISSLGGLILDYAVNKFHGIAVFQPVFNGVGGNLVAVQASRISTFLHSTVSTQTRSFENNYHLVILKNICTVININSIVVIEFCYWTQIPSF